MIMAACCLLTCFGAWLTWRRNPLYDLRSSLRMVSFTLAMIAVAVGVIVLTVRSIDGRSVAVQSTALAGAVIACTLGLIFGVSAVATPAAARLTTQLPPGVNPVNLNRTRILPWARVAAMIIGASLLLMLVPGPVRYIAGSVAAIGAGLAVIMLPVAYVTALRLDRAVTALQLHPWLHWHYAPASWSAWIERLADVQVNDQTVPLSPAARRRTIIVLSAATAIMAFYAVPADTRVRLGCGVASGMAVLGIALLTRTHPGRSAQRVTRRLREVPPDTYFGHDGVLCNGDFCTWRGLDVYLLSASVAPGPPRYIELWFEKILPGGYGGPQVTKVRQQVLIAADATTSDLSALQAALIGRCPGARIDLT